MSDDDMGVSNARFEEYRRENPDAPAWRKPVRMADGRVEMCIDLDTAEGFARWCLRKGYGDRVRIIEFLSDYIPRMRMPNWGGLLKPQN